MTATALPIAAWITFHSTGLFPSPAIWGDDEASQPITRATIDESERVYIGGRVTYRLDVLSADGWANLPSLPRIEIPGAIVYVADSQGIRLTETIDGSSYTGQRYEFWVYPQHEGTITIPSQMVSVSSRAFGVNAKETSTNVSTNVSTNSLTFEASSPPGVSQAEPVVCTTSLSVRQQWSEVPEMMRTGDGLTRTIERTIAGTPSMVLPPLSPSASDGQRLYPKQPNLEDRRNRGELQGRRIDAVTYVFEEPGEHTIPDIKIVWWDTDAKRLREETLPGQTITVASAPVQDKSAAGNQPPAPVAEPKLGLHHVLWGTMILAAGVAGTFQVRRRLAARKDSASHAFRRFTKAAQTNDARSTLRELIRWLDRVESDEEPALLDRFISRYGTEAARRAVRELVAASLAPQPWDGRDVLTAMRDTRRRYAGQQRASETEVLRLPELNPR